MGRGAAEGSERRHSLSLEAERDCRQFSEAKANQRAGKTGAYAFAREHEREHAEANGQGPEIGRPGPLDEGEDLLDERTWSGFDAEHRRRLGNENVARDADEKAGRHRNGQEVGDEAGLKRAGANEDDPDREAERRRGGGVVGRPRGGEHGQGAGEDGRNGRIRADRKPPARAEQRKANRPRDEREKADPRRQPGEAGGRHLLRDGDGG